MRTAALTSLAHSATVEELLAGKRIDMPPVRQTSVTHKRAPKAKGKTTQPKALDFDTEEEQPY